MSNELAHAKVSRLNLRLVCRDYNWSLTLAKRLARLGVGVTARLALKEYP